MNDHSAGYAELPRTAYLDHTLRRAWNAAQQRSHRYVTLEHLLLALLDDPDATELLQAVDADIPIIQSSVATAINNNTALVAPGATAPAFSYKFDNLFAGAFEDAVRAGRKEIDGAFVLVGVAKHPDSDAASILAANGFNAQAAQRTLEALLGPSPQAPGASGAPPARPSQGKKAAKPKPEGQRGATAPRAPSAADPEDAGATTRRRHWHWGPVHGGHACERPQHPELGEPQGVGLGADAQSGRHPAGPRPPKAAASRRAAAPRAAAAPRGTATAGRAAASRRSPSQRPARARPTSGPGASLCAGAPQSGVPAPNRFAGPAATASSAARSRTGTGIRGAQGPAFDLELHTTPAPREAPGQREAPGEASREAVGKATGETPGKAAQKPGRQAFAGTEGAWRRFG